MTLLHPKTVVHVSIWIMRKEKKENETSFCRFCGVGWKLCRLCQRDFKNDRPLAYMETLLRSIECPFVSSWHNFTSRTISFRRAIQAGCKMCFIFKKEQSDSVWLQFGNCNVQELLFALIIQVLVCLLWVEFRDLER